MQKADRLVVPLRIMLAVAFGALVLAQTVVLPAMFRQWAVDSP